MIKLNKPLKLGFVGGGINSAIGQIHYSASQLDGAWKVESGIFSKNSNVNLNTGKAWNISKKRIYRNLPDFIKNEKNLVDAVVVIVPIPNHFKIICELLKNNIPVISEKTMVSNLDEAKIINKICKSKKGFLNITYNYTGYPMLRELKNVIRKKKLGSLQQIHIEMPQDSYIVNRKSSIQKWRLKDRKIPTFLLDLCSHMHNLSYFLIGQHPKKIFSNLSKYSKINVVDNAVTQLEFNNGVKGCFWSSKVASGHRNNLQVRIFCSNGSAEWNHSKPEELKMSINGSLFSYYDRSTKNSSIKNKRYNRFKVGHPSGFLEAFANIYFDISKALISYKKFKKYKNDFVFNQTFELANMEILTQSTKSNLNKTWKKINLIKEK